MIGLRRLFAINQILKCRLIVHLFDGPLCTIPKFHKGAASGQRTASLGLIAVDRRQGAFNQADHPTHGQRVRIAGQHVPAAGAATTIH